MSEKVATQSELLEYAKILYAGGSKAGWYGAHGILDFLEKRMGVDNATHKLAEWEFGVNTIQTGVK